MKHLFVFATAAAVLSAAIPADAATLGAPKGTSGHGGRPTPTVCVQLPTGKHPWLCPTGQHLPTVVPGPFWLP